MSKPSKYDFSGWATKNNIRCSDGRTIMKDAFKANDGATVPLVWNHNHTDANNVLGHAILENRDEGVYAYCSFNNTKQGKNAKALVEHGDICALSIYANQLQQQGGNVIHGAIREVSLVLAGANPGAYIESVIAHADGSDEEATIYNDGGDVIMHSENNGDESMENENELKHAESATEEQGRTVQDVVDSMTDEQKEVLYMLLGYAAEGKYKPAETKESTTEVKEEMKHNAFENQEGTVNEATLSHSDFVEIMNNAKQVGSVKTAFENAELAHGVTNVENLFPEAQLVNKTPSLLNIKDEWVSEFMGGVHHSPFSRIKTAYVDITELEARAKGYAKKGNAKVEEVVKAFKRTTTPTTVYKLQKMDRDDTLDITDFNVITYIKDEMRVKLNEELARAAIFGDGREASSNDKVDEQCIRPIAGDDATYTIAKTLGTASSTNAELASLLIDGVVEAMDEYEGSGNITAFVRRDIFTQMLLLKDTNKHRIYKDAKEVALAMGVSKVVPVPASVAGDKLAVCFDLTDYTFGADKGGEVSLFDDFDINYNKLEYLIETRVSGALIKPKSAIAFTKSAIAG